MMAEEILASLDKLQPSQLFINAEKFAAVMNGFDLMTMEPVPVIRLRDQVVMTDGHTHALAAYLSGASEIPVYWDEDELDLEAYAICVDWCREEGIQTIAGLADRLLPPDKYEILWIKRCEAMMHKLSHDRGDCDCC